MVTVFPWKKEIWAWVDATIDKAKTMTAKPSVAVSLLAIA
jgi:hypothetical protein